MSHEHPATRGVKCMITMTIRKMKCFIGAHQKFEVIRDGQFICGGSVRIRYGKCHHCSYIDFLGLLPSISMGVSRDAATP